MPQYDDIAAGWTEWDGSSEIEGQAGEPILIAEVSAENKVKRAGMTTMITKPAEEIGR